MSIGTRLNQGKPKVSLVLEASHAIDGAAKVLEFGLGKYGRGNWRKGLPHTEIADSLGRHLKRWLAGEDIDHETGFPHVDHILVNALFLSEISVTHRHLDDRVKIGVPHWVHKVREDSSGDASHPMSAEEIKYREDLAENIDKLGREQGA